MIEYCAACIMLATRFILLRVKKLKDQGLRTRFGSERRYGSDAPSL